MSDLTSIVGKRRKAILHLGASKDPAPDFKPSWSLLVHTIYYMSWSVSRSPGQVGHEVGSSLRTYVCMLKIIIHSRQRERERERERERVLTFSINYRWNDFSLVTNKEGEWIRHTQLNLFPVTASIEQSSNMEKKHNYSLYVMLIHSYVSAWLRVE